jgi:hypothetical protein
MTHDETIEILMLFKGNWMRQPSDDVTIEAWRQIFADVDHRDARAAVMRVIRTQEDQQRIPTAGEIRRLSIDYRLDRMRLENSNLKRIGTREPPISPEQVAKGRQIFKEIIADLSAKMRMKR